MRERTRSAGRTAVAAVAVVLAATLAACASNNPVSTPAPRPASPSSPARPGAPAAGQPDIPVVRLGAGFDPDTLHLGAGQQFEVIVGRGVRASGSGITGACTPAAAARFLTAMLSLRCSSGSYLYTTRRAGSTVLSVTVRPACTAGSACPQWVARATLRLTVT